MYLLPLVLSGVLAAAAEPHPFALVEVNEWFEATGKKRSETAFLIAVNTDGSRATVDLEPSAGKVRQILDPVRKTNTVVNPAARTAASTSFGSRRETGDRCHERYNGHRGALVLVDHYAGAIHGVPVIRITVDDPSGLWMEVHLAPSLGCQMLQSSMRQRGVLIQSMTTRDLRVGPPDPALFAVPADYRRY